MTYVLTIRTRIALAQRDLRLGLAWFRRVVIGYVQFGVDKWLEILGYIRMYDPCNQPS